MPPKASADNMLSQTLAVISFSYSIPFFHSYTPPDVPRHSQLHFLNLLHRLTHHWRNEPSALSSKFPVAMPPKGTTDRKPTLPLLSTLPSICLPQTFHFVYWFPTIAPPIACRLEELAMTLPFYPLFFFPLSFSFCSTHKTHHWRNEPSALSSKFPVAMPPKGTADRMPFGGACSAPVVELRKYR